MIQNDGSFVIEDATLVFKNFAGREGKYNREGDRSFSVLLSDELAQQLLDKGWNVKELRQRDDEEGTQKYLTVSVRYPSNGNRVRPPTIVMITSKGRTAIDEDMCGFVDQIDIAHVDLIVRPYEWAVNGNTGVKAYLKSLYVTIAEDYLALKYRDVPEVGAADEPLVIEAGSDPSVIDVEWTEIDDDQKALTR